jgi:hypothetical protein
MLSFAGVASWSGLAGAQYFRADPTVRVLGGYSITKVVSDDPDVEPTLYKGPMVTIAPALALTYDTPRVTNLLTLGSTIGLPITESFSFDDQPPSFNLRVNYMGDIPLNERTRLTLTGASTASPLNSFSTLPDASLTPTDAPPADFSYSLALTGTETLARELTPDSNLTQATTVLYNLPFNDGLAYRPSTTTVTNSLSYGRRWTIDTVSLTGSVGVARFGAGRPGLGDGTQPLTGARTEILNNLSLLWARPITESLAGSLNVGVGQTISPGSTTGQVWQPTGGAQLTYSLAPAAIGLTYSYTAIVNVYTATTNLTNQISLRLLVPFASTGLSLVGSTGFVHAVPIGDVGVGLDSFATDISLTYSPIPVPVLSFNLRGLYARQIPLNTQSSTSLDTLDANTRYGLALNVGFAYPSTRAVDAIDRASPSFMPAAVLEGEGVGQDEVPTEVQAPPEPAPPPAFAAPPEP